MLAARTIGLKLATPRHTLNVFFDSIMVPIGILTGVVQFQIRELWGKEGEARLTKNEDRGAVHFRI